MLNVPIHQFMILAIIFAAAGLISMIFAIVYSRKLDKSEVKLELENVEIMDIHRNKNTDKFKNAMNVFKILALLMFFISLITMATYMYYNNLAIKYGAFDDFDRFESINSIKEHTSHGFIDQSNELPDDLSGCILIYFKYGCSDCDRIREDYDAFMALHPDAHDIYFVSSRSERGKELIKTYYANAVPSGVYILKNPGAVDHYIEILYDMDAGTNREHIFIPEHMENLLMYQESNY